MPCTSDNIPEYLHRNNRDILSPEHFESEHKIYRLQLINNPIEFPHTLTDISCKWSLLINEEDLMVYRGNPEIYDSYKYNFVKSFIEFSLKSEIVAGNFIGWHTLECILSHKPEECDYSHCVIDIRHKYYKDEKEAALAGEWHYTYDLWQQGKTALQQGALKQLRKDYRRELISLFYLPEN